MKTFRFERGDRVKDRVTGFVGIITSRADHISGCDTYGVLPEKLKDGAPQDTKWFDEPRLQLVKAGVLTADGIDARANRTGADSVPQATH